MIKFIDLFSGTGGFRIGFEQGLDQLNIRHKCVFASEIDNDACDTYELNFGERPYGDIIECQEFIPDFDFLLAGFPCQPFSYAGKQRGFGDTRGTLFFEIEKILRKHRPSGFILENVRGLTTHDKGRTFQTIMDSLKSLGYAVDYKFCNSSNYGVPQNRVRTFIIGLYQQPLATTLPSHLGFSDSHAFHKRGDFQTSIFGDEFKYSTVSDILEVDPCDSLRCSDEFTTEVA